MPTKIQSEFSKRFCPHRGIGDENTLAGIQSALRRKPFLVEFDVQYYNSALHLGHPPAINKQSTLNDALALFRHTSAMPKVDLKLNSETFERGLATLCEELSHWPSAVLVNIDGELSPGKFMEAETYLIQHTNEAVRLNIDLIRYNHIGLSDIDTYVQSLDRNPFSLSPNLDADIDYAIYFALRHKIPHIHFWAFYDRQYSLNYLCLLMRRVLENGLQVYFDIKIENITDAAGATASDQLLLQLR